MTGDILIELAKQEDYHQIESIWMDGWGANHWGTLPSREQMTRFHENFISRSFPFTFWVARCGSQVLGWVSVLPAFYHPIKAKKEAEISIYIDELVRNKGIGTAMLQIVLGNLEISEIQTIWAFIAKSNIGSLSLFTNAGLDICGATSDRKILIKERRSDDSPINTTVSEEHFISS